MRYVKVTNTIKNISLNEVTFIHNSHCETFLRRFSNDGLEVWRLQSNGIYVLEEFARAYELSYGK